MLWEICKIKIKEYSISYCTKKQSVKRNIIKEIENKIAEKEQELIDSNYRHNIQLERDILVNKLHNIIEDQKREQK